MNPRRSMALEEIAQRLQRIEEGLEPQYISSVQFADAANYVGPGTSTLYLLGYGKAYRNRYQERS